MNSVARKSFVRPNRLIWQIIMCTSWVKLFSSDLICTYSVNGFITPECFSFGTISLCVYPPKTQRKASLPYLVKVNIFTCSVFHCCYLLTKLCRSGSGHTGFHVLLKAEIDLRVWDAIHIEFQVIFYLSWEQSVGPLRAGEDELLPGVYSGRPFWNLQKTAISLSGRLL